MAVESIHTQEQNTQEHTVATWTQNVAWACNAGLRFSIVKDRGLQRNLFHLHKLYNRVEPGSTQKCGKSAGILSRSIVVNGDSVRDGAHEQRYRSHTRVILIVESGDGGEGGESRESR